MTAPLDPAPPPTGALALETVELTKRFGTFTAMDSVSMKVAPGSVHALLGENGAGKSTLVKCVAGSQRPDGGAIVVDRRERDIATPVVARALGICMVYQHFTLAPNMSVAENLLLAGGRTPALIDWARARAELRDFLATTPFSLALDATPASLSAGEKQKLELLKQLYLRPRLLILDEPTSVLTPQEADEVLAFVRAVARRGEILGIAGVSGNGQRELVEAIVGQRPRVAGSVRVVGQPYAGRRAENRVLGLRALPEEPLRNASVGDLSVAHNMALRDFDEAPLRRVIAPGLAWLRFGAWRARARDWIAAYGIKTRGENAPIASLSGGNVQRAVLARELAGDINVLVAANPVFGLDFAAVAEIHARIRDVRDRGGAVLLISEDLDELMELADRIVVMSEGRIVFETPAASAERHVLGAHMGGGHHAASSLPLPGGETVGARRAP